MGSRISNVINAPVGSCVFVRTGQTDTYGIVASQAVFPRHRTILLTIDGESLVVPGDSLAHVGSVESFAERAGTSVEDVRLCQHLTRLDAARRAQTMELNQHPELAQAMDRLLLDLDIGKAEQLELFDEPTIEDTPEAIRSRIERGQ